MQGKFEDTSRGPYFKVKSPLIPESTGSGTAHCGTAD